MRLIVFILLLGSSPMLVFGGSVINKKDTLNKRKVHVNAFVGTGLSMYQGIGANFRRSPAFPLNLTIKARSGAFTAGAFGQISQSLGGGYDYAFVNSSGMFAGAGYYGKKFSIGAGGGAAAIFSTEYFTGGPVSPNLKNVPPSHKYYNEFGYCGNVFMSFNDLSDWLRVSIQYSLIRTHEMKVMNLLLVGLEFGGR